MVSRRGFIKLCGTTLLAASVFGLHKLPIFEPEYDPVVLSLEDIKHAKEFWTHFEIKMSGRLARAHDAIETAGVVTPETQHEYKAALIREIAFGPVFAGDKALSFLVEECKDLVRSKRIS